MKNILFTFLLNFLAISGHAQPNRNIPATVLPLLQKAEYLRANFKPDSSIAVLEQAQREYQRLGMDYDYLCLYAKIFVLTGEMYIEDEKPYQLKINDFQKKRLALFPYDKWLEARYYLSLAWLSYALEQEPQQNSALKRLENNNFYRDWEIEFFCRLFKSFKKANNFVADDDNEIKNYALIAKNAPLDSLKTAYLYHSYPAYLWIGLNNLTNYYKAQKDYEKALSINYQILNYLEQPPYLDSVTYSTLFHTLSNIFTAKSDYAKAIEFEQKSIAYNPLSQEQLLRFYHRKLASLYMEQDDYKTAIKHAKLALKYNDLNENSHKFKQKIWTMLLKNYTLSNRFKDAKPYVDSTISNEDKNLDYIFLAEVGYFYQKQNDYVNAAKYYQQAANVHNKTAVNNDIAYTLLKYKAEWESKNMQPLKALSLYQQASTEYIKNYTFSNDLELAPLEKISDNFSYLKLLLQKTACIKKAYIDNKDFSALKAYQAHANFAIQLLNTLRQGVERDNSKTTLLNLSFQAYEHNIRAQFLSDSLANKTIDYGFIFKQMEDSKAFLLSNSLQENQARQFGGIPDNLIQLEKDLTYNIQFYTQKQNEINDTKTQILYQDYVFQFSQRLDSLKDRFKRDFPKYHQLKYSSNYVPLAKIQAFLSPEQAILSYFEGVENIFLLYIDKKACKFFSIAKPDNYTTLIRSFREIIIDTKKEFGIEKWIESATDLYQLFIPLTFSPEIKRLVVIADGSLHYTPFETFIDANKPISDFGNYSKLPYLIFEKSISYQYSAQLWYQLHQNSNHQKVAKLLAIAPFYEKLDSVKSKHMPNHLRGLRNSLSSLTGTIAEVKHLEKIYAGQFLYHQQATETQFKNLAAQYQIIHLAMHGLVNEDSPEFSSLAFSDNSTEHKDSLNLSDNFLQCYEIKALELNADLVVLSACETAYGKYERGEGAISIGRSFFYNGTKSLLMTQWAINDGATPTIIKHFYAGLQQGKSKDEALQYAKIQYLTQAKGIAAHPAYWAAFVQMGNTFNLKIASPSYFYYYVLFGTIILLAAIYIFYQKRKNKMEK